ncbi:MAG: Gfo/Idh/MocA family oxidoreductase [Burkholderiales bacterium]|nr:Gfo/Idh/MocA family oxidoreductase [Burkholderiales bacterium]
MNQAPHILIVGSGSVGRRHARNFSALGCSVSCVDPRAERRQELAREAKAHAGYPEIGAALGADRFDGVVICSPPHVHVDQALAALRAGIPVLLEKPVSPDLGSAARLEAGARAESVPVLLGYTWRWWPPLRRVRELLDACVIGELRHVQFHMSAHLADWHPWERYQDFFMASSTEGGGALLDESHWIDLALWMFGMPEKLSGRIDKLSSLEIETDDNVDVLMAYPGGLRVSLHLDLYGRPHEKFIRFVGEFGSMLWTAAPNQIAIGTKPEGWDRIEAFECERNDMFVDVAREFLALLDGDGAQPTCSLADGLRVLTVIEAIRRSSADGSSVTVSP